MNEMRDEAIRAIVAETLARTTKIPLQRYRCRYSSDRRNHSDLIRDRGRGSKGIAGRLSAPETLAQERRAGAKLYFQGDDYHYRHRLCGGGVAWRQSHARKMTRVVMVVVALLPLSVPAQAVPCWIVRKAVSRYGEATAESWAFSMRRSRKPGNASGNPGTSLPRIETAVRAIPDRIAVLNSDPLTNGAV